MRTKTTAYRYFQCLPSADITRVEINVYSTISAEVTFLQRVMRVYILVVCFEKKNVIHFIKKTVVIFLALSYFVHFPDSIFTNSIFFARPSTNNEDDERSRDRRRRDRVGD